MDLYSPLLEASTRLFLKQSQRRNKPYSAESPGNNVIVMGQEIATRAVKATTSVQRKPRRIGKRANGCQQRRNVQQSQFSIFIVEQIMRNRGKNAWT